MGIGERIARRVQSLLARRKTVGPNRSRSRHETADFDGETPRRILPLAIAPHRSQCEKRPLEKPQGRRRAGIFGSLQSIRTRERTVPLSVEPQPCRIRHTGISPGVPKSAAGTSHRIRRRFGNLVRRGKRRHGVLRRRKRPIPEFGGSGRAPLGGRRVRRLHTPRLVLPFKGRQPGQNSR